MHMTKAPKVRRPRSWYWTAPLDAAGRAKLALSDIYLAPGGSAGVGVGMSPYTGYFTTTVNTANYVAIHCK